MMKRILLVMTTVAGLSAHEQPTHLALTAQALNYLRQADPARAALLQQYGPFLFADGSWNEDGFFAGVPSYLGRFYFHFLPNLSSLGQFATCTSIDWGIKGSTCTAATTFPLVGAVIHQDEHTWAAALAGADPSTHLPTLAGWTHLGYLVHLLEDLTSPPHVRDSAHPCAGGLFFCDPFEEDNVGATAALPASTYLDFSQATRPEDIFTALATYVRANYFSAFTTFDGNGGPVSVDEDGQYFYGSCLQTSRDFGTCVQVNGQSVRKIAYKGLAYYNSSGLNPRYAAIDSVIAREQFAELGPLAVGAVAALVKLYAPAVSVTLQGTGAGAVTAQGASLNCPGACAQLYVQGSEVQLVATPSAGSIFVGWGGGCAAAGSNSAANLVVTSDVGCTATFAPGAVNFQVTSISCPAIGPVGASLLVQGTVVATGPFVVYSSEAVNGFTPSDPNAAIAFAPQFTLTGGDNSCLGEGDFILCNGQGAHSAQWSATKSFPIGFSGNPIQQFDVFFSTNDPLFSNPQIVHCHVLGR